MGRCAGRSGGNGCEVAPPLRVVKPIGRNLLLAALKSARIFILSCSWNEQSPVLPLHPPYSLRLTERAKMPHELFVGQVPGRRVATDAPDSRGRSRLVEQGCSMGDRYEYEGNDMTLQITLLARLVIGTALGALIGYERQFHGRPAGLRTHLIVALASTTFMIVSTHFVYFQHYAKDDLVVVDSSRIAASVVTGIGFLGAGAILRTGISVQGLTTAAGLWLVAAIGLSAGAGMYVVSVAATALGATALTVLRRFEGKNDHLVRRKISLVLSDGALPLSAIFAALAVDGAIVSSAEYEKEIDEHRTAVTFQASFPAASNDRVLQLLETQPGVRRLRIEPLA